MQVSTPSFIVHLNYIQNFKQFITETKDLLDIDVQYLEKKTFELYKEL